MSVEFVVSTAVGVLAVLVAVATGYVFWRQLRTQAHADARNEALGLAEVRAGVIDELRRKVAALEEGQGAVTDLLRRLLVELERTPPNVSAAIRLIRRHLGDTARWRRRGPGGRVDIDPAGP